MYSVGSASDYGAQMLSHDFIKRLTRELVFNLDGQRVYGMTFSNWVCTHHVIGDPPFALSHVGYGEMAVERVERSEEGRGRREEVEGWEGAFYTPNNPYLPKMDGPLLLPFFVCSCLFYLSRGCCSR
ncbi:hypothetical protein N7516_002729 [Penicillium verrucosum]|uniref:uncharacterized protein n=1 Tax=Penicillium verrucosum TaxID=60171 RepID=UPI0025450007|nr:uncharacterized protein N7516_002729 [Penicillium verrucosum]KAJ5942561.1 hypothetical protein N7516_002729 [Penicillium verrucosum]